MKNSILLITFSLFIMGCKKDDSLVFLTKNIEKTYSSSSDLSTTQITLNFPYADSKDAVSDSINNGIKAFIEDIVYLDESPKDFNTYEEIADSFISSYQDMIKDFPNEVGWEVKLNGYVTFQRNDLLNIKIEYYVFTGGAHGYFGVKSLLFDTKTGKKINLTDLFKDIENFRSFVENKFRTIHKIDKDENINSKGFMFENDEFHLPENIIFTEKAVTLLYNSYEIASYADGPQELLLNYEEIQPFLNINLK